LSGRGAALRAGAQRARGDILFFLHADSTFPTGGLQRIEETLSADPSVLGGNFRVVFDGETWFSLWATRLCPGRTARILLRGFRDLCSTQHLEPLGGFRPIALMEDLDFVHRLERTGKTCCIDESALITSSRRFEGRRPAEIISGLVKLHVLFWLGVSPARLAEIYQMRAPRGEVLRVPR
jgi:glycosyltransferase involved in cell wall biosynthesis